MKISAQEEYGLRCLVQLANLSDGETLTLPQIAEREGISTANAGKLMWLLNKAGFVNSTRGTKGGYFLARPAEEIFLNEIIKVLDEDVLNSHCESYTGIRDSCVHHGDCGIRPVIVGLHEIVENALSRITLANLVGNERSVDAMFHQIQGIHRTIEPQRI
ncbi:RrF2 family transcriptional regulator [Leptolyngbya sp. 7M]|uniref:RrF2 family transcriptional regulator n=1 Tax=Leptolyngbya sp. 7M TaxID=2812896 RepID=UPI001B8D0789|nr:Rrf2 family transcriptional regulator [Leptolyngbya sp. 7M]QYO67430.1 Rrf2 family transcriptional regulator [Leptolyngbya sp. 7M]